ncbi:competence type IV pilus minor pilin ComGD [Bacillus smithii]|uniref:competence type IV pilus minor pilin ComGD n=1 Tax=Bacillus smithii TaxID=1479 RepID=UPI0030C935F0
MKWNSRGYTLLEALLVLMMISAMLLITVIPYPKMQKQLDKQMFITQLRADMERAQMYALSHQKSVFLRFYSSEKYVASLSSQEILFTRKVPEGFEFLRGGMDSITFLPTGNTNQFGTIAIKFDHQIIQFTIYIGKGRINVKEESL